MTAPDPLALARECAATNALLRTGADVEVVWARFLDRVGPDWMTAFRVAVAALPADRTVEQLLAWTVEDLPSADRPSWFWRPVHDEFVELSALMVPSEVPLAVREGERRYREALRREASRFPEGKRASLEPGAVTSPIGDEASSQPCRRASRAARPRGAASAHGQWIDRRDARSRSGPFLSAMRKRSPQPRPRRPLPSPGRLPSAPRTLGLAAVPSRLDP